MSRVRAADDFKAMWKKSVGSASSGSTTTRS